MADIQTNAPKDLNLTDCYVSSDGGNTKTPLIDIKTSADTATTKVAELEQKITDNSDSNIDTSKFLTTDSINKANGVVGTNDSNEVWLPVTLDAPQTWLRAGKNKDGTVVSNFSRTGLEFYASGAARPYQNIYKASADGACVEEQIWSTCVFPASNNDTTLGKTGSSFKDLFLVNAPTITSDENTKNVITSDISSSDYAKLLDAVYSVKASLYTIKDAVSEKGSDARTHAGFIAQQLEAAVKSQGLDPSQFSFWCSSPLVQQVKKEVKLENGETSVTFESELVKDKEGNQVYQQSLRYEELFVLLLEAVKVKMASFEERLAVLEDK